MILTLIRSLLAAMLVLSSLSPLSVRISPKVTVTGYGTSIFPPSFMPSKGDVNVLVVPVSFSDYSFDEDPVSYLTDVFSGRGSQYAPSLTDYFDKASYGSLSIHPTITSQVTLPSSRSSYSRKPDKLIDDVLSAACAKQEVKLSDYDANGDGILDGLYLVWAGPSEGFYSDWWPNSDTFYYDFRSCGIRIGSYTSLSYSMLKQDSALRQFTAIHETGHQLGLADLYRSGNQSGTGTNCMMDLSSGDEDPFSKMILGWMTPQQADESGWYQIKSESSNGDALLIAPSGWDGNLLSSYYLVEYVTPDNNQRWEPLSKDGAVRIWRINAATSAFTDEITRNMYKYSNDGSQSPQLVTVANKDMVWYGQKDSESGLALSDGTSDLLIYIGSLDGSKARIYVSRKGSMPAEEPAYSAQDKSEDNSGLPQSNEQEQEDTGNTAANSQGQDESVRSENPAGSQEASRENEAGASSGQAEETAEAGPDSSTGQREDASTASDSQSPEASYAEDASQDQSGAEISSGGEQKSKKMIPTAVFIAGFAAVCWILLKDPKKKKKKRRSSGRRKH